MCERFLALPRLLLKKGDCGVDCCSGTTQKFSGLVIMGGACKGKEVILLHTRGRIRDYFAKKAIVPFVDSLYNSPITSIGDVLRFMNHQKA